MKELRLPLSSLLFALFACLALAAEPVTSVVGIYESEGSVVHAESGHEGPVSLRALLALDFDLAQGAARHPEITRVDIQHDVSTLTIRTLKAKGEVEWSAEWKRNGGFEATKDGVKLLVRGKRNRDDLFMFTLSLINQDAALLVKIERIEPGRVGPIGKPVGTFLFLRATR
jgi:hypothetical protein